MEVAVPVVVSVVAPENFGTGSSTAQGGGAEGLFAEALAAAASPEGGPESSAVATQPGGSAGSKAAVMWPGEAKAINPFGTNDSSEDVEAADENPESAADGDTAPSMVRPGQPHASAGAGPQPPTAADAPVQTQPAISHIAPPAADGVREQRKPDIETGGEAGKAAGKLREGGAAVAGAGSHTAAGGPGTPVAPADASETATMSTVRPAIGGADPASQVKQDPGDPRTSTAQSADPDDTNTALATRPFAGKNSAVPNAAEATKSHTSSHGSAFSFDARLQADDAARGDQTGASAREKNNAPALPARADMPAKSADVSPHDPSFENALPRNGAQTNPAQTVPEPVRLLNAAFTAPAVNAASTADANALPLSAPAIAVEIVSRLREGLRRFEIRLDPPELGRIEVRLDVDRNGHATTRLTVDRPETLDLLQREARGLERALQSAGLKTDDGALEFSLRQNGQGQEFDADRHQNPPEGRRAAFQPEDETPKAAPERYRFLAQARGGVDIRI